MADVDDQSAAIRALAQNWPMIDALMNGTAAMRAAADKFLPKWPNEEAESYKVRLSQAVLFPAYQRTANVMAAKPLARPIALDESLDSKIVEWLNDVDLHGTTLHAFAVQQFVGCLSHGLRGVLVDYPTVDGVKTKADEEAIGARPYFTQYPEKSILGWRVKGGKLTQIRLLEEVTEEDGDFGEKTVTQVRVLTPGKWQIWRKVKVAEAVSDKWMVYQEGITTIQEVPFVFFYGICKGFGIGLPPLLDLAFQNVEHWQSCSDQQTILHVARVPVLFAKGFGDKQITIGASSAASSDNPDAELEYVEHTGQAIGAGRTSILDLEERMRQTGAELLTRQATIETATQVVSDGEANKSTLQKIAEEFEQSLQQCIDLMGDWVGIEVPDKVVSLYKDFGASALSDDSATALQTAAQAGNVSKQTVFEEFQRRDIISPDLKWEDEQKRIQDERKALPSITKPAE
jgi:hypothetical protein